MKLSVIIPVFNEEKYICEIVKKILKVPIEKEIIIVDDYSKDNTRELLSKIKNEKVKIFYHKHNKGKAGAIKTAQKYITGDIVIIQDGDLEYEPMDYIKLVKPIIENRAKAVYGNRFYKGFVKGMTLKQRIGNFFMTFFINIFLRQKLNDMETCYKTIKSEYFKKIKIESKGFGIDPEITAKLIKMGIKIKEIPIHYYPRTYNEGKKINIKDAIRTFYTIIKYGVIN